MPEPVILEVDLKDLASGKTDIMAKMIRTSMQSVDQSFQTTRVQVSNFEQQFSADMDKVGQSAARFANQQREMGTQLNQVGFFPAIKDVSEKTLPQFEQTTEKTFKNAGNEVRSFGRLLPGQFGRVAQSLEMLGERFEGVGSKMSSFLNIAGKVAGVGAAGFVGWKIGRAISEETSIGGREFFGLGDISEKALEQQKKLDENWKEWHTKHLNEMRDFREEEKKLIEETSEKTQEGIQAEENKIAVLKATDDYEKKRIEIKNRATAEIQKNEKEISDKMAALRSKGDKQMTAALDEHQKGMPSQFTQNTVAKWDYSGLIPKLRMYEELLVNPAYKKWEKEHKDIMASYGKENKRIQEEEYKQLNKHNELIKNIRTRADLELKEVDKKEFTDKTTFEFKEEEKILNEKQARREKEREEEKKKQARLIELQIEMNDKKYNAEKKFQEDLKKIKEKADEEEVKHNEKVIKLKGEQDQRLLGQSRDLSGMHIQTRANFYREAQRATTAFNKQEASEQERQAKLRARFDKGEISEERYGMESEALQKKIAQERALLTRQFTPQAMKISQEKAAETAKGEALDKERFDQQAAQQAAINKAEQAKQEMIAGIEKAFAESEMKITNPTIDKYLPIIAARLARSGDADSPVNDSNEPGTYLGTMQ